MKFTLKMMKLSGYMFIPIQYGLLQLNGERDMTEQFKQQRGRDREGGRERGREGERERSPVAINYA